MFSTYSLLPYSLLKSFYLLPVSNWTGNKTGDGDSGGRWTGVSSSSLPPPPKTQIKHRDFNQSNRTTEIRSTFLFFFCWNFKTISYDKMKSIRTPWGAHMAGCTSGLRRICQPKPLISQRKQHRPRKVKWESRATGLATERTGPFSNQLPSLPVQPVSLPVQPVLLPGLQASSTRWNSIHENSLLLLRHAMSGSHLFRCAGQLPPGAPGPPLPPAGSDLVTCPSGRLSLQGSLGHSVLLGPV